ncbi:MAG: nuclear transport factor 2 family protein [Hyphococcus sp.]
MKPRIIAIAAAALLAGCGGGSTEEAGVDEAAVLAALDAQRANFESAVATGDMAALGALITPQTIMVQPGSSDWKAMQAQAGGMPFAPGARIDITPVETKVINEEWAYEFGASIITYPSAETGDDIELRDTYLILLRNDGNGWKPFREVASASPPPGGWPQNTE